MHASDVLALLDVLDAAGVRWWLDGGWGVDALQRQQTRSHADLDLVVLRPELDLVLGVLERRGFAVIRDWLPTAVALRDTSGREVDLHPVDPTPDGGGDQVLADGASTWHYSTPVVGEIAGRAVPCCSAVEQMTMHMGYEARDWDAADVARLAAAFGLPLPATQDSGLNGRWSRTHDEHEG